MHQDTDIGPSTSVSAVASADLDQARNRFVTMDLPSILPKRSGPVPPVVAVSDQTGRWDVPSRTRVVVLGDGSTVNEEITHSQPRDGAMPEEGEATFGYTVFNLSGPLSKLATEARGFFTLKRTDDGRTAIDWHYAFAPTNAFARPVLALINATFWRAYMREGRRNLLRELERA